MRSGTMVMPSRSTPLASLTISLACNSSLRDRKSTRLNSSHLYISYAVFCLNKDGDRRRAVAVGDRAGAERVGAGAAPDDCTSSVRAGLLFFFFKGSAPPGDLHSFPPPPPPD